MASLNIFQDDAFSLSSLTKSINDTPHMPGRIGELGIFSEESINTTSVMIERVGQKLNLVPAGTRGVSAKPTENDKRSLISLQTVHLPQRDGLNADEVQGIRAFGSESELDAVSAVVNKRLAKLRRNIDVTMEYQRIGALKGQVLDADGTTVLIDMFDAFGLTKTTHSLALGTATTKVRNKVVEAKRKMENALGGLMYTGVRALCSASFFDSFVGHGAVEEAYDRFMNGQWQRDDVRGGFWYAGVYWEEYRGKVGTIDFIPDGKALMVPEGVPDLAIVHYAPADYMDTVNTNGVPYYARQELRSMNKGVDIEAQSNPLALVTRPNAIVELSAT